jgi:hypothetical protein
VRVKKIINLLLWPDANRLWSVAFAKPWSIRSVSIHNTDMPNQKLARYV